MNIKSSDLTAAQRREWLGETPAENPVQRRGAMNKYEAMYARQLELEVNAGTVIWWAFEPIRIRLADGAYFCPDFVILRPLGLVQVFDIKGHRREASIVRIKVAAEKLPWARFALVSRDGSGWKYEWM